MSLREILKNIIQNAGGKAVSVDELHKIARENNYATSNADRRLRQLRSLKLNNCPTNPYYCPQIKSITNERGAITHYYWQTSPSLKDNKIQENNNQDISTKYEPEYLKLLEG